MGTDVWASSTKDLDMSVPFGGPRLAVVGRLATGVTLQQTRAALRLVAERTAEIDPERHAELTVVVEPVRNIVTYGTGRLMTCS